MSKKQLNLGMTDAEKAHRIDTAFESFKIDIMGDGYQKPSKNYLAVNVLDTLGPFALKWLKTSLGAKESLSLAKKDVTRARLTEDIDKRLEELLLELKSILADYIEEWLVNHYGY